jgi:hypothetical protein
MMLGTSPSPTMDESKFVSLREVDMRFAAQKDAVDAALVAQKEAIAAALAAAKEAVTKAELATEKRFENSNEWRNTVETLQRTYTPRTEVTQVTGSLTEKIEALQKLIWVGLGILLAFQFFIGIALIIWKQL